MSEMGSDEITPDDRLHDALIAFTGCVGEVLDNICSYGLTIGDSYVPFTPDEEDECDDNEELCSQAWVRVTNVSPVNIGEGFDGATNCAIDLEIGLEVGVLRCFDIPEDGEAPTASEVLVASLQSMTDMRAIFCAANACEVWASLETGQWNPIGPLGGQYGGIWTFTATL